MDKSINFLCDGCRHPIEAPAEHAGKSAKCPHCGIEVTVPRPVQSECEPLLLRAWPTLKTIALCFSLFINCMFIIATVAQDVIAPRREKAVTRHRTAQQGTPSAVMAQRQEDESSAPLASINACFGPDTPGGNVIAGLRGSDVSPPWNVTGFDLLGFGSCAVAKLRCHGPEAAFVGLDIYYVPKIYRHPSEFLFRTYAYAGYVDTAARPDRVRKISDALGHIGHIVPLTARQNMTAVLEALPCTRDSVLNVQALCMQFGDLRHLAAIEQTIWQKPLRATPGPTIGIRLHPDWVLEVSTRDELYPAKFYETFLLLAEGPGAHTCPYPECVGDDPDGWNFWPQYNPFNVPLRDTK